MNWSNLLHKPGAPEEEPLVSRKAHVRDDDGDQILEIVGFVVLDQAVLRTFYRHVLGIFCVFGGNAEQQQQLLTRIHAQHSDH